MLLTPQKSATEDAAVDPDEWRNAVGVMLERARKARRMSIRGAAAEAGFDEAVWRQLEQGGRRMAGAWVPANPRDENLEAAALAVGLDPAEVFEAAGRTYTPPPTASPLEEALERLRVIEERLGIEPGSGPGSLEEDTLERLSVIEERLGIERPGDTAGPPARTR